ncbi:hypothetical protein JOM56_007644 [Amanita muscaria]
MSPSISHVGSGVSARKTPLDNSDREPTTVNAGLSDAEKPFDASAKADVILRSSDSVDFFVLKAILCLASPVFDHIFSITQESSETKNGLPVVDLAEDSTTLYNLLPLLYPYAKEPTDTLEVYTRVAEAAQKYAMDETLQKLKKLVMTCGTMVEEPVATFAVAMHFGWVEVMREAALNSLAIPLPNLVSDGQSKYLHFIDLADYRHLLSWRFACQDILHRLFARWRRVQPDRDISYHGTTSNSTSSSTQRIFSLHLQNRLKETGCPRSTVLMDDRFVSDEKLKSISLSNRGLIMKDIENIRKNRK